ncbi:Xanthine/uracil permease family protein [Trifolium repens]|nr:Xanthine/uracil permease family protein [Trifolium repens]
MGEGHRSAPNQAQQQPTQYKEAKRSYAQIAMKDYIKKQGEEDHRIILSYEAEKDDLVRYQKAFIALFSPIIVVPVVCVVGLGLFARGFPLLADCVQIGLPMLILLILTQQYLRRLHAKADHILERFALLACIAVVWAFAAILTVAGAIKSPLPFQWGTPIFKATHVFGMMGAALVSSAESTGTYFAVARLSGATPPPAHVLSRSIGLQYALLEGIFGCCVGTIASVENVGLLGLTHIGSRRVVQMSCGFMIFFSIFGKFGAFFASIPLPIFAAIYCVLFGIVGRCCF